MNNYIFAYGSLIESNSRKRTAPDINDIYPARISGFMRGWFARVPTYTLSTTFLGCIKIDEYHIEPKDHSVNGVFFKVQDKELENLDKREAGYTRVKIEHSLIDDFLKILSPNDNLWIYVNEFDSYDDLTKQALPNWEYPIVQSYIDICINGCFEIEEKFEQAKQNNFLEEFISQTQFWNEFWVNDRIFPRRPFIYCPNANEIDKALFNYLEKPALIKTIKIE